MVSGEGDSEVKRPVQEIADEIIRKARVLCFDEFQVRSAEGIGMGVACR